MKIMIIDDEPDIRTYLMAALEDSGYETCTADDNDSLDDSISEEKPDLIILDIMMPKRSGISIYRELRTKKAFKDIPVALISGMTLEKSFLEFEFRNLIGNDTIAMPEGFIEKPVQIPVLLEMVEKLLKTTHKET